MPHLQVGAQVLGHIVRITMRIGHADRADRRPTPVVLINVSDKVSSWQVWTLTERTRVGASIYVGLDLLSGDNLSLDARVG